jgi:hypothetical protein
MARVFIYDCNRVNNLFGIVPINVFQLGVIYKSYRQVLTQSTILSFF